MRTLILLSLFSMLASCVTQKEWQPMGGSRADGIVVLSYSHNNFEMPEVNEAQASGMAALRCKAWGYTGATPFGTDTKRCTSPTYGGCQLWQIDRQYQCTGQPDK